MGIGYQNKSLKEMLGEKDRLLSESGHLWGLKELALHQEDPAKMMRFQLRVLGACITSRELAKLTAASPIVCTVGECIFMLLVPEGDVAAASLLMVVFLPSWRPMVLWVQVAPGTTCSIHA